jgi:hypothetical protein
VDRYTLLEWLIVLDVFVLSMADLVLTLLHLSRGAAEANPVMALALRGGHVTFAVIKVGVTTLCLLSLLIHVRYRRIWLLLALAFLVYAGVFVYHRALPFFID